MKNFFKLVPVVLFASLISIYYFGCNKTDHPFGINAPKGLDVPSPTPLPFSGQINTLVVDDSVTVNGPALTGIVIIATDRDGAASTLTTNLGTVTFNFNPITPGIWTVQVPAQSIYALSQKYVTIGSANRYIFLA